jgi:hypothetical protein
MRQAEIVRVEWRDWDASNAAHSRSEGSTKEEG